MQGTVTIELRSDLSLLEACWINAKLHATCILNYLTLSDRVKRGHEERKSKTKIGSVFG